MNASDSILNVPSTLSDGEFTRRYLFPKAASDRGWRIALSLTGAGTILLFMALFYTTTTGIGTWGNNIPAAWGVDITNFVWWIGIGHAGTFISAILFLLHQRWRTSINRLAEAMTLFAVVSAALFPIFHLGRAWFFYWLFPYPATYRVWPQFRSALTWDVAAISTYITISFLFWFIGLIPDLAAARDQEGSLMRRRIYGVLALGWRGSAANWRKYRTVYLILAGLATPLVVSVHTIVSLDFATTLLPGWHSSIFPPYFVAGAIFSGFAMVATILIPLRRFFSLQEVVTRLHLDLIGQLLLLTGLIVTYSYIMEFFMAWYSGNRYERFMFMTYRPLGPYHFVTFVMLFCNVVVPNFLWLGKWRQSESILFLISILINVGMWLERYLIIVSSTSGDFLPSSWGVFIPTIVDGTIFLGTLSFFGFLLLLFVRFLPMLAVTELKELRNER
jgi:Ni/Fe-hydrogenase subunit HybB-like protein